MTFLNGLLAFGALAFTVPLAIHLLHRSRFRTVDWGAMHLLASVTRVNQRRLQLHQLILLLIRCLIPVLLAFCLARPVLTAWQAAEGESSRAVVMVLDESLSMDAQYPGGRPIDRARQAGEEIIESLPRGSQIMLLAGGGGIERITSGPAADPERASEMWRGRQAGAAAFDPAEAIAAALGEFARASESQGEILVFSDLQETDWQSLTPEVAERLRERRASMEISPRLTLLPAVEPNDEPPAGNVSVDALRTARRAIGVGQSLRLEAEIRNRGSETLPDAEIQLLVDGRRRDTARVDLAPEATTPVALTTEFDEPGTYALEVLLEVDDGLAADNTRAMAVQVVDRLPVVLVDGQPSDAPLESEVAFLSIALSPFAFSGEQETDLVAARVVRPQEVDPSLLAETDVLVLANVPRLEGEQPAQLAEFVHGGGALLVFSGDQVDAEWYNENLVDRGLLPMAFGEVEQAPEDAPVGVASQFFEHPALQPFNEGAGGDLTDVEISQWHRLEPLSDAGARDDAPRVLARLRNQDPLLVEVRRGQGVVGQAAIPCDAAWSNLPMRPAFLPLMQNLVVSMALRNSPERNFRAGESAVLATGGEAGEGARSVLLPDGSRRRVHTTERAGEAVVELPPLRQPGTYTLYCGEGDADRFAVTAGAEESALGPMDDEAVAQLAEGLDAEVARSPTEYLENARTRRDGREVWRWMLFGLLGMMALEMALQQRFARIQ